MEYILDLYQERGIQKTYEQALDEAAADYADKLLEDGRMLDEFLNRNRDNRTLLQKLLDAIREILGKLTGKEKTQAETAEGKFSLKEFSDGTRFVDVETDILTKKPWETSNTLILFSRSAGSTIQVLSTLYP